MVDTSEDAFFIAIHPPLLHFCRLRLPAAPTHKLMHGATLITARPDETDKATFNRWSDYIRAEDPGRREYAIDEPLLRTDRMQFEPYRLLMQEDGNVLRVAMESGFGSLSAFNKSFRKIAGKSPSDFRRHSRLRAATGNRCRPGELSRKATGPANRPRRRQ